MITGSVASSLQGEPRATHDIDLVVEIDSVQVGELIHAFPPPEFYLDGDAVREAVSTGGMFNLLETAEGDKVDFWLLSGSEKLFTDAVRVFEVQHGILDKEYLETWASRLGVVGLMQRLLAEAEPI